MGIEGPNGETHFMLDAASQIATLGLGFNPLPFFVRKTLRELDTYFKYRKFRKCVTALKIF